MAQQQVKTLSDLDAELAGLNMRGQWQFDAGTAHLTDGPSPAGVPYLWHWPTVQGKLLEACEIMPESFTARRAITFTNPGLQKPGSTQTIVTAIQMVMPGEVAWAHRHTMGAIRFVIEGDPRLYTAVDGERLPMEPNDLVLTPNWTWHDHHNDSDKVGIWLDVLDVPLTFALNQAFYEPFGESVQPLHPDRSTYLSERARLVRPAWESRATVGIPLRYPWKEVRETLYALAKQPGSPHDGTILEYVNPMTGGSTLPTLGCYVQLLRAGAETERHRHTSSAVYYVVSGSGTTIAGDQELRWNERDVFAIPNWTWHRHVAGSGSDAILFSVTDEPVLTALGFYREEPARETFLKRPPQPPAVVARRA